jgi:hypothetical protein
MDDEIVRAALARKGTPFLSSGETAFYLGLSVRKLQQMRVRGLGPPYRRFGRVVRYHIDDVDRWSENSARSQVARQD